MKRIIIAAIAVWSLYACQQPAGKETEHEKAAVPALQAPYAQEFYDSLQLAVNAYLQLAGALVDADSARADLAAATLHRHIDSLPLHILQIDSSRQEQLRTTTGSISAELGGLLGEPGLGSKRESFEMVSDMLYDLVKNTGLKGHTLYRQYCPMAFNDRGAYWLSDTTEILNPYFGKEMLHCGDITDTLNYH
jgi:hypothetical protein